MIDRAGELDGVRRSHARLLEAVAGLDDETASGPSLLPGWTVAMLVTHLARNADSHRGMLEGAARGEVVKQYPSQAARDAAIEASRGRPAAEAAHDLAQAVASLEAAWDALPADRWSFVASTTDGEPNRLLDLPFQRWRESEVHLVDLGIGFTHSAWDAAYVDIELDVAVADVPSRTNAGLSITATDSGRHWVVGDRVTTVVEAPATQLLAWLLGRQVDGFPELGPWRWTRR